MSRRARRSFPITLFAVLICALPQQGFSQAVYGSIFGTVTDASGGGVPNAKISITDVNKNVKFETTTNEDGNYSRTQLTPGVYQVNIEVSGFRQAVSNNVQVNADVSARVDIKLEVGAVTEKVEVTAEAPMLKSDRSDVAITFTQKALNDLPSFGRNFQSYELLVPGTQKLGWAHASSENPQGSLQIEVNGQHFSGTSFQLDGTDNQDPILGIIVINPTLDSVTESKVTTQNYDAEFGLAIAGVVTAQTKSGTNAVHGSAFEYVRDNTPGFTTFARDPFNAAEAQQTPPVKWNQFGGSLGGHIIRDKLFYFGDVQLTRRRTGSSVLTSVPTAKARNGDFSEYLQASRNAIYDPMTGDPNTGVGRTPFPGNRIDPNRISSQAKAIMASLPASNTLDSSGLPYIRNYATQGSENFDSNQYDSRWDYYINTKATFFARYSFASFNKFAPGAFGVLAGGPALNNINFAGTSDTRNQSIASGLNYTFSPSFFTEFRFGFMRYRVNVLPNGLGSSPAKDAGIPGLNLDNFFTSGMPYFDIQGDGGTAIGYSLGANQCNCPLDEQEQQFQFVVNNSKLRGNHNIKFGADIRYAMNLRVPSDSHRAGELSFNNGYTGIVPAVGAGSQQGLGLATFELGGVTHFTRYVSPFTDAAERQKRFFWYVQDTWRATPKLTINYGIRWEMIFPEKVNGPGKGGALDLSNGTIAVYGVGQVSDHGIVDMDYKNIVPRLGVSYQVNPKTVIRAGYGWSYSIGTFGSIFGHNVTQNLPVLAFQTLDGGGFQNVFRLSQGPPAPTFPTPDASGRIKVPDGINAKARPSPIRLPRVEAYNVTVQRQLSGSMSFEIGYVGNVGRHSFNGDGPNFNVNQPTWIPGVPQNNRKPYFPLYGWTQGIDYYCNCATTSYNSLQTRFERRFAKGYGVIAHYTLAKGVQDSGDSYTFLYNRPLGRGINGFDREHVFVLAQNWDAPIGRGRHYFGHVSRPVDFLVGGWSLNGTLTMYSGLPIDVSFDAPSGAVRPDVGPGGRPDRGSGDPYAHQGRNQWLTRGLGGPFLLPPNSQFGNYGPNALRGPMNWAQDLSAFKTFKPTERISVQIRAEAFNVFNHTNLGLPNSNITSADAGKISGLPYSGGDTALGLMRRMQFGFRLGF